MGVISVFFQIAPMGGLTVDALRALFYWQLHRPRLTEQERKVLRPACAAAFVLF